MERERRLEFVVTRDCEGVRVDTLLRSRLHLSGTVIKRVKWLEDGILVDGARVNTRFIPRVGQTLSVRLSDPVRRSGVVPAAGDVDMVYEDEDLVVVNKAAGVSVHPGPGHYDDTLGNFLVHHFIQTGQQADFHPVHRLDRGTSGLLVCAKHAHAQERLKLQLHTPDFVRTYLAVCEGVPKPGAGIIDAPIGPAPGSLMAQQVRADGKPARTRYEVLKTVNDRSLVRLVLDTGRTHQIRVHMAHIGHPLVGDFLYGTEQPELIGRTALHACRLRFRHPITEQSMAFEKNMPSDMTFLVE